MAKEKPFESNPYEDEVCELVVEEAKKLGEDFVSYMKKDEVWHPNAWANSIGKTNDFLVAIKQRYPKSFGLRFKLGLEILAHKIIKKGMQGGADKWMLRTLALMHDQELREFEQMCMRFQASLGKPDESELNNKVDTFVKLMQVDYDKIKTE